MSERNRQAGLSNSSFLAGDGRRQDRPALPEPAAQLAVLVDTLDQDYQSRILQGIEQEAAALGVTVRCFALGRLQVGGRSCFELCSIDAFEGLILLAGTFAQDPGLQALIEYCQSSPGFPICCVGGSVNGATEVTVNCQAGMKQALAHFAGQCGRRRFAFIRGPEDNEEAQARYAAFRQGLDELSLNYDEALVVDGDFLEPSGLAAIATLLDERHQSFDAVIAANDLMALGALRALHSRSVPVPQKVAVLGYDDIPRAQFTEPPLATIRQPVYEQGRWAVREVVARIAESSLPQRVVLDASFIARGSCGERALSSYVAGLLPSPSDVSDVLPQRFEEAYRTIHPQIVDDLSSVLLRAGFATDSELAESLLVQATTDIIGQRRGLLQRKSFVEYVEEKIHSVSAVPGTYLSTWQEVVTVLQRHLGPCLKAEPRLKRRADSLWDRTRSAISYVAERTQASRWLSESVLLATIHESTTRLLQASSMEELANCWSTSLQSFEVLHGAVALRVEPSLYKVLLHVEGGVLVDKTDTPSSGLYRTAGTIHADIPATNSVLTPLSSAQEFLGYALFSKPRVHSYIYSSMATALATTLKRLLSQ